MDRSVTLRYSQDADGTRYLEALIDEDGALTIRGQDVGDGVERFFGAGNREYEWTWTVQAEHVASLDSALGSHGDVLAMIGARFSGEHAAELQPFLTDNDIPFETWSRVGG
jgi:hypothetical protein